MKNNWFNNDHELSLTKILFLVTSMSSLMFFVQLGGNIVWKRSTLNVWELLVIATYTIISAFIIYGNFIYHLTRIGLFSRLKKHFIPKIESFDRYFYTNNSPLVTFLIPSYKEELKVIEQTLWSAALQYYPNKRIVLLIDNPPNPDNQKDIDLLTNTRQLIFSMNKTFKITLDYINREFAEYSKGVKDGIFDFNYELSKLDNLSNHLSEVFTKGMKKFNRENHVDNFYLSVIYAGWHEDVVLNLQKVKNEKLEISNRRQFIRDQYLKLLQLLKVEFDYFERKRFVNLSHEPNKAMNINSYLHLIGKRLRIFEADGKRYLEETMDPSAESIIPDSKYVITLDADSMLRHDYAIKLVDQMEKKENNRVAVIQTPYSSYPGAKSPIEVVAGATTDIQYNIHQGFTYYNSTYWVGANAMLRKSAMDDIKMYEIQSGKVAVKYVQDRTVIEDTESSIDLVHKGWGLLNYPERLAYSSTPPDFGSLIIQRQRWANGGLIIFPKLLKYLFQKPFDAKRWVEFVVRSNYLVSIAGINIGTLFLLMYPFSDNVFTFWLPLASIPYYFLYTRDLKQMGYKGSEILRVYALNLILIPINIAGVLVSIKQWLTNTKIPFKRTPKIGNRVAAEKKFILFLYFLLFYTIFVVVNDTINGHWSHVVYSLINGSILFYAIKTFIGFKESWEDIKHQLPSVAR